MRVGARGLKPCKSSDSKHAILTSDSVYVFEAVFRTGTGRTFCRSRIILATSAMDPHGSLYGPEFSGKGYHSDRNSAHPKYSHMIRNAGNKAETFIRLEIPNYKNL